MYRVLYYSGNEELIVDKHVQMLIQALSNVSDFYLGHEEIRMYKDKETNVKIRAERVFAYELYHQFRLLMKDDCGYYLNGEIRKSNDVFRWERECGCYPDLVLHGNLTHVDNESQYFLCEIKMSTNTSLLEDLSKLTDFCNSDLAFQNYIFVCIGLSRTELIDIMKGKDKKYDKRILCICRKDKDIEVFKL